MLLAPAAIDSVREELSRADFYRPSHGRVFEVLVDLRSRGAGTDAVTVAAELERRGWLHEIAENGRLRVHELASIVPPVANVRDYAAIVATVSPKDLEQATGLAERTVRGALKALREESDRRLLEEAKPE
jgi:replicative DNA helicase